MGLTFNEDANFRFWHKFEALLGKSTRPATVGDVKALGEIMRLYPEFRAKAIEGMGDRFLLADGEARQALWKLCLDQIDQGGIGLPTRALQALFPEGKEPSARDLYALQRGLDGSDSGQPWVQVRAWLSQVWTGQGQLRRDMIDGLMHTAMFGAVVRGNSGLLDELLADIAKEEPVYRAGLLESAMNQWSIAAVFHLADRQAITRILDTLIQAGADVNSTLGRRKEPITALACLSALSGVLREQEEANRLFALDALLVRGANWKDVILDRVDEHVRLFIGNHPAVRRDRLTDEIRSTARPTGPARGSRL